MYDTLNNESIAMKYFYIILLVLGLYSHQTLAQTCPTTAIELHYQHEINDFPFVYPGCSDLPVSLTINPFTPITNLNGLSQLNTIQGDLKIRRTELLNFNGLNNLNSITGSLIIDENDLITDFTGFEGLTSIGNNLDVQENENLINFNGLQGITTVPGDFIVRFNSSMTNFAGLVNLESIVGEAKVEWNDNLINFQGLGSLGSIGTTGLDRFRIEINNSLVNFSGLENLTQVQALWINGNESLENLWGLQNLTEVSSGGLSLWGTPLPDFTGMLSLTYIGGFLDVAGNDNFVSFQGLGNVTYMDGINVRSCPILEDFGGLYNLETLGNIYVDDSPQLRSFHGLQNVTDFDGGGLSVTSHNNGSFESLDGIDFIDYTTIGDISITNVQSLTDCAVYSVCDFFSIGSGSGTLSNGPGCSNLGEVLALCAQLSVDSKETIPSVILSPNPAKTNFILNIDEPFTSVTLYDALGNVTRNFDLVNRTFYIGDLTSGIYFVKIETESNTEVIKLMKR